MKRQTSLLRDAQPRIEGGRLADHFKKYIAVHMAEEVFGLAEYMGRAVTPETVERANIGIAEWGGTLSAADVLRARGAFAEMSRIFRALFSGIRPVAIADHAATAIAA